ncbi:hypothetical protein OAU26_07420 [Mariniblastus sp.]|nr:hypothetical protein [Mariniblastus sp.]
MLLHKDVVFRNNAVVLLMFAICLWPGDNAVAQLDLRGNGVGVTACDPVGSRLLSLWRYGNGASRNAEIVILEIVDPKKRIRVLHKLTLLTPYRSLVTAHSRCGRFVVTVGESKGREGSLWNLVIYDLVRGDHSAYRLQDFLSDETIDSLKPHPFMVNRIEWCRMFAFNYDRMEFYPSVPQTCRRLNFPFVVVNLLSRKVRVEAIPDNDIERIPPVTPFFPNGRWVPSTGDQPLPSLDKPFSLPAFLRVEFGELDSRKRRVFRLDKTSGDYLVIPESDWPDEKLPAIGAGMYRNDGDK